MEAGLETHSKMIEIPFKFAILIVEVSGQPGEENEGAYMHLVATTRKFKSSPTLYSSGLQRKD